MSSPASRDPAGSLPPAAPSRSAPAADALIGHLVNDKFRILGLIARGGMGKVYRAEQIPLGRICAVKILNPKYEGDEDPEFQKRFFLEAATAAKLTHPNTVTIFDYGRDGDIYYIAMEYIQGRTLYRILREEGPLRESRVGRIMSQVCRALREAHQLGVIHRDMKPANIAVLDAGDEADRVKVLDFGLVKEVAEDKEDLTQEGMFMGSPKYMAPEQILGNPVSAASDIYSLGIVAYELLTGKVPFDKGASVKTMMAHVNEDPPAIRSMYDGLELSDELEAILERCLLKNPEDRFADMDALLRALSLLGGNLTDSLVNPLLRAEALEAAGISGAFSKRAAASGSGRTSSSGPRASLEPELSVRSQNDSAPIPLSQPADEGPTSISSRSALPDGGASGALSAGRSSAVPSATPAPMSHLAVTGARPSRLPWALAAGAVAVAIVAVGLSLRSSTARRDEARPSNSTRSAASAPAMPAVTATSRPTGNAATSAAAALPPSAKAAEPAPRPAARPVAKPAPPAPSAKLKTPVGYKSSPY